MTTYIKPTVLYIKQHSITGLKYFGKTTRDPLKYNGSGKHWLRHIKKHDKGYVITLWVSEPYIDSDAIIEFALAFSRDHDIVASKDWANIINENGLDGGFTGPRRPRGPYGPQQNPSGPRGPSGPQQNPSGPRGPYGPYGPQQNPSGPRGPQQNPAPKVECPHCGKIGNSGPMKRWHFDHCKK